VRGILTFRKCSGWVTDLRQAIDLQEAVTFLKTFMDGLSEDDLPVAPKVSKPIPMAKLLALSREKVRQSLVIPSPYFVTQGFSPVVLNAFDVGHSAKRRRSIVPLYDDRGEVCIGYLARSEKPYCPKCKKCHEPRSACRYGQRRWSISENFPKSTYLFNYHNVLRSPSPNVLLVEGPGDAFKAIEAGLTVVALLGNELTEEQANKLVALGKEVIITLDNDEAGRRQTWVVYQCLRERGLRTRIWHPPEKYKDVGEMSVEEVAAWMEHRRRHEEELDAVLGPSG
jgi:5S rRNA maturation endonuclease (ribonuclease M5)